MKPSWIVFILPVVAGVALYKVGENDRRAELALMQVQGAVVSMSLEDNRRPIAVTDTFVTGGGIISVYYSFSYSSVPSDSEVRVNLSRNGSLLGSSELNLRVNSGFAFAVFHGRFSPGNYSLDLFVEGRHMNRHMFKVLDRSNAPQYSLTVRTEPRDARVRIMNIKPVYRDGIRLFPGPYRIEVTRPGYKKFDRQIFIAKSDVVLPVRLTPM